MRHATLLAIGLGLAMGLRGPAADSPASIEKIIQQLGSPDPKTRTAARKALEKLGPDALPILRKALTHPDIEIRKRIAESVPLLETAALVAPKLVSLKAEKKTARQLFDGLSQQTGYKIDLRNDDPKEVFNFDFDNVPFWKAIDEIGKLSGLNPQIGYGDDRLRFQKEIGIPADIAYDGVFRFVPVNVQHNRTLGFRRIGEPGKHADRSETLTLSYVLHSEPKLPMLSIADAQVLEALDSEGGSLMPPLAPVEENPANPFGGRRVAMRYGNGYAAVSMQGAVSLGRPSGSARAIKLLRIGLPVTLLAEQKPEVVTDRIMEAKKKKVTVGTTTFDIESCELTPEKQYRLKMSVTEDKLDPNDYTWMNSLYRRVELLDDKGNKLQISGSSWGHSAANHVQATFNFGMPGGAGGAPRKMTYQVWKTMPYTVRLELKDLPLP